MKLHGGTAIGSGANSGYVKTYDTGTVGFAPGSTSDAWRNTIAGNIEREAGATAAGIYDLGMEIADFGAAVATGGKAAPALLAANTGTDWFLDAKARGVNDNNALLTGVLAAGMEALFDKFSLEKLWHMEKIPVSTCKDVLYQAGTNMAVGFGDSTVTSLATYLSDYLTNDKLSVYGQAYEAQLANGKSEQEAKRAALEQVMREIIREGAEGAIQKSLYAQ